MVVLSLEKSECLVDDVWATYGSNEVLNGLNSVVIGLNLQVFEVLRQFRSSVQI
jgi:hypothetical protein